MSSTAVKTCHRSDAITKIPGETAFEYPRYTSWNFSRTRSYPGYCPSIVPAWMSTLKCLRLPPSLNMFLLIATILASKEHSKISIREVIKILGKKKHWRVGFVKWSKLMGKVWSWVFGSVSQHGTGVLDPSEKFKWSLWERDKRKTLIGYHQGKGTIVRHCTLKNITSCWSPSQVSHLSKALHVYILCFGSVNVEEQCSLFDL